MKLSKETVEVLKNFASINTNLLVKQGSTLSTISTQKNVFGDATVSETFPQEFGIYDLNQFLGVLSLFDDPELEFQSDVLKISQGKHVIKYAAAATNILVTPQKSITFPEDDAINIDLSKGALANISKAASVLGHKDVAFVGDGNEVKIQVLDKKSPSSNTFDFPVGTTDKNFTVYLKIENLKMITGDYTLSISPKKISRFSNKGQALTYYVAVEADSTFA
jgi:hypothetical protein